MSFENRIPEFSDRNYVVASYICGALVSAGSGFFIYEMFTAANFSIGVNWNIFDSAWFGPLFVIGLILAVVNWGKFGHWGGQPYNVYKDSYGKKYVERNDDIIENLFAHIIMPLLGHFLIEPVVYACLIYYPLMCCFSLIDMILPYAITLLLVGLSGAVFVNNRFSTQIRYRSLVLVCVTLLTGGGLTWVATLMHQNKTPSVESPVFVDEAKGDMFGGEEETSETLDDMFQDQL